MPPTLALSGLWGLPLLLLATLACLLAVLTFILIRVLQHPPSKTYAYMLARELPVAPEDVGLVATDTRWQRRDGTHALVWEAAGRGPAERVMIFTHGFTESRYANLPRLALLAPLAGRLITCDLRAHADCSASRSGVGTLEVDDLMELMERFAPGQRVTLWGHSFGAAMSIAAALREPARVEAVIADGPYVHMKHSVAGALWRRRLPTWPTVELADQHLRFWLPGYRGIDAARDAAQLKHPLLILHGTQDDISAPRAAERLHELAPHSRLVWIEGARHGDLTQVDPAGYFQACADFLHRTTATPRPA